MVAVVLLVALAITGYVAWLMWNGPASPPLPPGRSELSPLKEAFSRPWQHRPTS